MLRFAATILNGLESVDRKGNGAGAIRSRLDAAAALLADQHPHIGLNKVGWLHSFAEYEEYLKDEIMYGRGFQEAVGRVGS